MSDGSKEKRRLNVLREPEVADEADLDRPPWHWAAIGVVAIFVVWVPLILATNGVVGRAMRTSDESSPASTSSGAMVAVVVANTVAFAVAAFAGGVLVCRFGAKAGRREATVSGIGAAAVAWLMAAFQGATLGSALVWALSLTLLAGLGAGFAYLGGRAGIRLRNRRS